MSTDVSDEKAIITIEVELVSDVKGDPVAEGTQDPFLSGIKDELSDVISEEVNASIKDSVEDTLAEEGIDLDALRNATGMVKDLDNKAMGNIKSIAKSPESFMENTIISTLSKAGPYGALAAAIITAIIGAPALVEAVVNALGVKGGPLNQDFKFSQDAQMNQQFDRRVQFRRLTGDDPVITVTTKGFARVDPDFIDSSLVDTNLARTARITLRGSSLGYIHGI